MSVSSVSGSNPPQSNRPDKMKMLEQYAISIVEKAVSMEKAGDLGLAVQYYLKAADILLIMSKNASSYNDWNACSERAASYHKKVRSMLQQIRASRMSQSTTVDHPSSSSSQTR
jgi:hypothetical protein